jgi:adenine nucleotide transporter 17
MSDDLSAALRRIFTLDSFADGCAGASGGISAISVFYPLNIIRTRLQTDDPTKPRTMAQCFKDILSEGGIPALYTGWWAQIIALGSSNFVYFYVYNMLKVIIQRKTKRVITPTMNLAVGAVAGVVNVLMTTPLWMMCTQLAVQRKKKKKAELKAAEGTKTATGGTDEKAVVPEKKTREPYKGMWDGLTRCYKDEGIGGLWKGLGPNLMLVSNPTIHFFVYERLRVMMQRISEKRGSTITSFEFFCLGAMAKATATLLTYPVQVAQSQLRNDRADKDGKKKFTGTVDCLTKLYKMRGFSAWFQGMYAKLWQTVLTAAFQFMTYENLRGLVFKALTGKELRIGVKKH